MNITVTIQVTSDEAQVIYGALEMYKAEANATLRNEFMREITPEAENTNVLLCIYESLANADAIQENLTDVFNTLK